MEFARKYLDAFADLFHGNPNSHGVHVPEPDSAIKEGEKAVGKSYTKKEGLTHDDYLKHLHGEKSVGIVPIDPDGNVRFAVIDVDVYPLNPVKYLNTLRKIELPFVGFRSKSGGLHLYLFMAQDTPATKLLPLLKDVVQILGLKKDTEIFPKQTRLMADQKGSWINAPYYKYKETRRYAYDFEGKPLNLEDALHLAENSKITVAAFKEAIKAIPLTEAPPCLQTIFITGGAEEGNRNAFLFNCAIYLKAEFNEDFGDHLHELNRQMERPVEYEELDRTVIASHNKGDYSYQCTSEILRRYCDKELCNLRQYGKTAGVISNLSFEQLTQVQTATPYYKWLVNGVEMTFYSEAELLNQNKFRELSLSKLHKVPSRLTEAAWGNILNRALANLETEVVDVEDDLSEDSLWLSKVVDFFSRGRALRPSQIEEGLVWETDDGMLYFKGAKLLEHLEKTNLFRHFKKMQHYKLLKELGGYNDSLRFVERNLSKRAWRLDLKLLHKKGLFLDVSAMEEDYEKVFTPLDFLGKEDY